MGPDEWHYSFLVRNIRLKIEVRVGILKMFLLLNLGHVRRILFLSTQEKCTALQKRVFKTLCQPTSLIG